MTEMYLTPGWVILGAESPDNHPDRRVTVVASQKLTQAELVKRLPEYARHLKYEPVGMTAEIKPEPWDLTMVLEDLTVVMAPTYAEALQRLFTAWSPDVREAVSSPRTSGRSDMIEAKPLGWPFGGDS